MKTIKILGIAGSLRHESYNKAVIEAAKDLVPKNVLLTSFDIQDIPLFNQDFEYAPPDSVKKMKTAIMDSDAIVFATPEYNYSVPGVLKNAIDWASRPYGESAWEGKPAAIMSASAGMLGGVRAQYHLRQTFVFLNMYPLNRPEVIIPYAEEKFDKNGKLTDTHTREKIQELLAALTDWTKELEIAEEYPSLEQLYETYWHGAKGGKQYTKGGDKT